MQQQQRNTRAQAAARKCAGAACDTCKQQLRLRAQLEALDSKLDRVLNALANGLPAERPLNQYSHSTF